MREKPKNYGEWWQSNSKGAVWYASLYEDRAAIHAAFIDWYKEKTRLEPIRSVLEVGCGCAVVYPNVFTDIRYVGYDISEKEIAWSKGSDHRADHAYLCGDFLRWPERPQEKFDLVFSHAVVDHVYDIDAFVEALVSCSKGCVYMTAYRGWFPEYVDHQYLWDENTTCFYNDLSPKALMATLRKLGCPNVEVTPMDTGKSMIKQELIAVAKAPR